MSRYEERVKRIKWLEEARFGMFIHWGIYAIPARNEWMRSKEQVMPEEYYKYFHEFNPKACDMNELADLAVAAGMKYAIFTTKHHDGFCMFDSQYTEFKSTNTKAKRDFVREYVEAFRSRGIKVGLYYSLADWEHPEYPAYGDVNHPLRNHSEEKDKKRDFSKYLVYYQNQLKELLTNYGKIDIIWFDGVYNEMVGEVWEASKVEAMIRQLQPEIIINDRMSLNIQSADSEDPLTTGDYYTPECIIPVKKVTDCQGRELLWETCVSADDSWCHSIVPRQYRKAEKVVHILEECVSKGGNLLLNIGPDANGRIAPEMKHILLAVGEWLELNGESIYGCGASDEFPKPDWGFYTQNGKKLYAHVLQRSLGPVVAVDLKDKAVRAHILRDGAEVRIHDPWNAKYVAGENHLFLNIPEEIEECVVEIDLKQENTYGSI